MTMPELAERIPDERAAERHLERTSWPDGERCCLRCGSMNVYQTPRHPTMPWRCRDCQKYFSLRTNTLFHGSSVSLKKWIWAMYLEVTSCKGISSCALSRAIGVTQKTAWFMLHRLREAFSSDEKRLLGPVEVDETYFGGKARNRRLGAGLSEKTIVVGLKDRTSRRVVASVVDKVEARRMKEFVFSHTDGGATVYTDGSSVYKSMGRPHSSVNHSAREYVRGEAHTNGIESFWSLLKRSYHGTYHYLSPKHLHRFRCRPRSGRTPPAGRAPR